MHRNITHFLENRSKLFLAAFGLGLFAIVVLVDHTADWEITSSVIYLLPVSFFGWYFSSRIATLLAFFSVFTWMYLDYLQAPQYVAPEVRYWNAAISLILYLIFVFLVAEVKGLYVQERENSRLDYLTGVINRRGFYEALARERERASRLKLPLTLAYVDIDDFKGVNDRFDHITGDEVLASVGQTLRTSIRNTDLAGRLGGDEFCLLLPHTDAEGVRVMLEKMRDTLAEKMKAFGWPVTFSIGAVTFLRTVKTADEMLRTADNTMYAAKERGKDRIRYALEP